MSQLTTHSNRAERRYPSPATPGAAGPVVWRADERGSVTVIVVAAMAALLAMLALGIDLGGLFNARSEAQRAADAAALAGASAFLEYQEDEAQNA
ncbi:MAG: pilus assembly protein TadG-related protein, partial [Gemmatimonadota bacterium]